MRYIRCIYLICVGIPSWLMVAFLCLLLPSAVLAQNQDTTAVQPISASAFPDTVRTVNPDTITDPNFVIASILVASPGNELYSEVGHAFLRMQCPTHNLDYVFSYESENVNERLLTFLMGNLKMGLFAIPTFDYLDCYKQDGRGVTEYTLNIPIEAKRNLWRVLDGHITRGISLPYDYIEHGCAQSTLTLLKEGLDTLDIEYGTWPDKFRTMTRRELLECQIDDFPWSKLFLYFVVNGTIDCDCSYEEKVVIPTDLADILSRSKVAGQPLVQSPPKELFPCTAESHKSFITPLMIAIIILLVTVICVVLKSNAIHYVLLAVQTLLGIVTTYLVFFSDLCCTEWSVLIVPFNPLPFVFWKWRYRWALPYAALLLLWSIALAVYPHKVTDWTYIVFSWALATTYIGMYLSRKNISGQRGR